MLGNYRFERFENTGKDGATVAVFRLDPSMRLYDGQGNLQDMEQRFDRRSLNNRLANLGINGDDSERERVVLAMWPA